MVGDVALSLFTASIPVFFWYRMKDSWPLRVIAFAGVCYPLGKCLQAWEFGPIIARSYLADFGFVPCFTIGIALLRSHGIERLWRARVGAVFGLVIAIAGEIIQFHVEGFAARGDVVDLALFVSTFVVVFAILQLESRRLDERWMDRAKLTPEDRRLEEEWAKAIRRPPGKVPVPPKAKPATQKGAERSARRKKKTRQRKRRARRS